MGRDLGSVYSCLLVEYHQGKTYSDSVLSLIMSLAVCVLFYNKVDQTIECLSSFLASGVPLYVLNNNSDSEARATLGQFVSNHQQITIYDSPENLGVGRGRNYLINHSTEEWLLFVDNDITMKTTDWLEKIQKYIDDHLEIEVFIPQMFNVHNASYAQHLAVRLNGNVAEFSWIKNGIRNTNMFPGGASFCKRSLFARLGDYDYQMFVGFEDFEMGIRSLKMSAPIHAYVIEDIELIHDHRQLVQAADLAATKVRYDFDKIAASEARIKEKHGVVLDNDWRPWVKEQIALLNKEEQSVSFLQRMFSSAIHKFKMLWLKQK